MSSNWKYTENGQDCKGRVWKKKLTPLRKNETFKQPDFALMTLFFVSAVLGRVKIRTEGAGVFLTEGICVKVQSNKLPFWIGNYVTVKPSIKLSFTIIVLVHFWEDKLSR